MDSSFLLVLVAAVVGFFMLFRKFRFSQDTEDTKSSSLSLPSPPTSLSLPSPSTSLCRTWKHNVFPSFHGADVRGNILSHILEAFKRKGIDIFIDNNIERSKSIGPALKEAITGSKIAIVLLSKNYASSSWCLDELAEIMNCRKVLGQIVMTIFYEVDPTDIKKQIGDFGKAFRKTCKGKTKEHIERWRKALEDVATIAGEHSRNWNNDAAMIEKIATDVSNILNNSTTSRDFDGLVGMRTHMEEMKGLLRLDLDEEVRMIGIWGPPGIGKTTIARVLFNQVSSRFQLGAIMVNIRGYYKSLCRDEYNAKLQLQSEMLSQIINQQDIKISHLRVAQERLKDKKVLLVLDEVDQLEQLDALAKEIQWFGPGSRIIITTEDLRVLKAHRINNVYKVKFPSSDEAFQIFCMHAFGQKHPDDGFFELAWEVTYLAGELPLGLKVLGSALRGMSKQEWKWTLPRLKTQLDKKIGSIIKFSYEALDDEDKYLFLYIACLFNYEYTHKVEEVLANQISSVGQRLHILAQKSLISIDVYGRIDMHTLLRKFGRETSRKEFVYHGLAKRQLLVGARDICEVFNDDTIDCKRFIGINIDFSEIEEELNLSEVLHIKSVHAHGKLSVLFDNHLSHCSSLVELPSSIGNANNLQELNLFCCSSLLQLPSSIGNAINLQELNLSYCRSLVKIPSSIENATNLQKLYLSHCSSLVELPSSIGNTTNLQILDLSHCSNLVELPSIGNPKLEILNLADCSSLVELSSSINAPNLRKLSLKNCSRVVKLPAMESATNLRKLDLEGCSNLVELPSIGNLKLEILNLTDCSSLVELSSSINAPSLQELYLRNCSRVVKLPSMENVTNLQKLDLEGCSSLQELPPSIGTFANLWYLNISECSSLVELHSSIENMTSLQILYLSYCSNLMELPAIENATSLRKLYLQNCLSLQELPPSIGTATNLEKLDISGCSSLVKLPSSIGDLTNLEKFYLSKCSSLVELPSSIGNLQQLYYLIMRGCSKVEALPTNINLVSLCVLDLSDCSQLKCFPEISTNIGYLRLTGTAIKEVPSSMRSWSRLSDFHISYFESLKEFPHAFDIITKLVLVKEDIKEVPPWVKGMSRLDELRLDNCNNLVSLPQFSDSLSYLVADNCQSLERLDCSFNNPRICLQFVNCLKLNQEARDLIMHTTTSKYAMLPGIEVPDCFNHRAIAGGSLTIKLNESQSLPTSLRFKACIMLVKDEEESDDDQSPMYVYIGIKEKQKDLKVQCTPKFHHIDRFITEHIYTFEVEVEAGEVTSTEFVFKFKTDKLHRNWKIGECGLLQISKASEMASMEKVRKL